MSEEIQTLESRLKEKAIAEARAELKKMFEPLYKWTNQYKDYPKMVIPEPNAADGAAPLVLVFDNSTMENIINAFLEQGRAQIKEAAVESFLEEFSQFKTTLNDISANQQQ